jgi:NADPH:quinone reductase-like Zn-dependent oxidoreductase
MGISTNDKLWLNILFPLIVDNRRDWVRQWGQFFIGDKPYKGMLKPWNGKSASEEKGVLPQTGMELIYRVGGLRGREIGELLRVGYRSVSQERKRLRDRLSDDRNAQSLFKGFLGKCNDRKIDPLIHQAFLIDKFPSYDILYKRIYIVSSCTLNFRYRKRTGFSQSWYI